MRIAIISSSLNPSSRSRLLALQARARFERLESVEVDFLDLQEWELPLCDGGAVYADPKVVEFNERMGAADVFVLASPIYNYDVNAALKNAVELGGRKMEEKLAGFLCAAGGAMSYMSVMPFANSLMLDFRTLVLPRFVYAKPDDWEGDVMSEDVRNRLERFCDALVSLGGKILA